MIEVMVLRAFKNYESHATAQSIGAVAYKGASAFSGSVKKL